MIHFPIGNIFVNVDDFHTALAMCGPHLTFRPFEIKDIYKTN